VNEAQQIVTTELLGNSDIVPDSGRSIIPTFILQTRLLGLFSIGIIGAVVYSAYEWQHQQNDSGVVTICRWGWPSALCQISVGDFGNDEVGTNDLIVDSIQNRSIEGLFIDALASRVRSHIGWLNRLIELSRRLLREGHQDEDKRRI
jgi:hypothetical protein